MSLKLNALISAVAVLLISACNAKELSNEEAHAAASQVIEADVSAQSSKSSPEQLRSNIESLIGQNLQCAADSDCKLVGLGARPCGGPDEYRVYSVANGVESKLLSLVSKYNALAKKDNESSGRLGICVVAPKPLFSCVNNLCQTDSIATGGNQS